MKHKKLSMILLGLGAAGLILSFLLAIEYFALGTTNIASSACSALGGGDGCSKVAESKYSAIPNLPLLGNVPIALFGFGFYGLLSYLSFLIFKTEDENSIQKISSVLLVLALAGLLVDIFLFSISIFIIKTICQLCFLTYLVTIGFLVVLVLIRKQYNIKKFDLENVAKELGATLAVVYFFSFSFGYAASKMTVSGSGSQNLSTSRGMDNSEIAKKIEEYEKGPDLGLTANGSASIGKSDAPITIVKYADFNCGHCLHTSHILHTVLAEYDGMVRVIYKNFPLDGSCNRLISQPRPGASSCIAAIAAICADKQGKFEPMYRGLYDNTEKGVGHTASTVLNLANQLSLNSSQLKSCMGSKEAQNQLSAEIEEAAKLDIQSTPSLFINGKRIDAGTPNPEFLKALLEKLIQKL